MVFDQKVAICCTTFRRPKMLRKLLDSWRNLTIPEGVRPVFIVVEKPNELDLILDVAGELQVSPLIGLRCRLSATSSGFWAESAGDNSKFGLSASELLDAINRLKQEGRLDCLRLLHFHIGSQVPEMRQIKEAVQEAARYFVEARRLGAPIDFLDVGGGLGVNYDGSISGNITSVDYLCLVRK